MKGWELIWVEWSLQPFDETPRLERLPVSWLGDATEAVEQRMQHPWNYCQATVCGHWGQRGIALVVRYMPCLERTERLGELCAKHAPLVPPKPATVVRQSATPAVVSPPPAPKPAPPPPPPSPSLSRLRCLDCRDYLKVEAAYKNYPGYCWRCARVRIAAERAVQPPRAPPVWRCKRCRVTIPTGTSLRLCQACIDSRLDEDDGDGGFGSGDRDLPRPTTYRNRRGEWVAFGHVLNHSRYGESRADRFGDSYELDD